MGMMLTRESLLAETAKQNARRDGVEYDSEYDWVKHPEMVRGSYVAYEYKPEEDLIVTRQEQYGQYDFKARVALRLASNYSDLLRRAGLLNLDSAQLLFDRLTNTLTEMTDDELLSLLELPGESAGNHAQDAEGESNV